MLAQSESDGQLDLGQVGTGRHDVAVAGDAAGGQCQLRADGITVVCCADQLETQPVVAELLIIAIQHGAAAVLGAMKVVGMLDSRAKEKNRNRIQQAADSGKIKLILNSNVKQITENAVTLLVDDMESSIENDAIIVSAGGILPTAFLKETGIEVETKYGTT